MRVDDDQLWCYRRRHEPDAIPSHSRSGEHDHYMSAVRGGDSSEAVSEWRDVLHHDLLLARMWPPGSHDADSRAGVRVVRKDVSAASEKWAATFLFVALRRLRKAQPRIHHARPKRLLG